LPKKTQQQLEEEATAAIFYFSRGIKSSRYLISKKGAARVLRGAIFHACSFFAPFSTPPLCMYIGPLTFIDICSERQKEEYFIHAIYSFGKFILHD
jgi:hypothetical protein